MRIVMIGPFAWKPKATVSARVFPIARALVKRGHLGTVLMVPYDNPAQSGRTFQRDGVDICNLTIRRDSVWSRLIKSLALARQTRRLNPDVVHVFKPIGYTGLAGMWLHFFSSLPLVVDTDDWEGTGGWSDVNPYPRLWKALFNFQERWLPRHADAVTVASRTLQTQVWGLGVAPANVFYVPNCFDAFLAKQKAVAERQRREIRLSLGVGEAPLAMYVGHIPLGNDLDIAVKALPMVAEKVPEIRLVFVGDGDGLSGLREKVRQLGQEERVLFTGWVEHEKVPAYLAAADVAIYPFRDTLINRAKCAGKIHEYMVMDKPIVTGRVGQNTEYIKDRHSGLLTEPGDVADFARSLVAVLSDREWAAELGRNAGRRIRKVFDWDRRVVEVEKAYQVAMARSRR